MPYAFSEPREEILAWQQNQIYFLPYRKYAISYKVKNKRLQNCKRLFFEQACKPSSVI